MLQKGHETQYILFGHTVCFHSMEKIQLNILLNITFSVLRMKERKSYEFEITRRWVNHESWQNFHFCVKWPFKCISMSLNSKPQSYSLIVCELLMSRVFQWRTVRLSPAWIFLCMQSTAIFKTSLFCQFYTLPQQMRAFLLNELIKYLLYELQTRASLSSINMHCFL